MGGGVLESHNPKCKDLPKFELGGVSWKVKTQSAKICLNLNFRGEGCVFWKVKTQSAKICPNFNFGGGCVRNQIPEQGCFEQFGQKFLEASLACASQIVSHILRMWRLNNLLQNHLLGFIPSQASGTPTSIQQDILLHYQQNNTLKTVS